MIIIMFILQLDMSRARVCPVLAGEGLVRVTPGVHLEITVHL